MKRAYLLLFIAFLFGCNTQSEESKLLFQFLKDKSISEKATVYLLIPIMSCGHCTEESISFMDSYEDNPKIQFVASGDSKRDLKRVLGQKAEWSNVFLDVKNTAFAEGINNGGVTAFVILENQALERRNFDPTNIK
ncbi:MAG: hypothetical protein ACI85I_000275 [Arenicella sp.]|jgi:hypothetical protein